MANDDYLKLFTSEYQNSSNLLNWANTLMAPLDDVVTVANDFLEEFDLETAIGDQLDIIGEIVGAERTLPFEPTATGSPAEPVSPILDDETYRIYLKAKIALNHWDGLSESVAPIWERLFPGGLVSIQDNLNMTMDIFVAGITSQIILDMIENRLMIPRPEGVGVNINIGSVPFFGFDLDNSFIAGFDVGKFL